MEPSVVLCTCVLPYQALGLLRRKAGLGALEAPGSLAQALSRCVQFLLSACSPWTWGQLLCGAWGTHHL